jgi:hypothetical protein
MIKNNPRKQIEFRSMVAAIVRAMANNEFTSDEVIRNCVRMEDWVDNYISEEVNAWIAANSKINVRPSGSA